MFVACKKDEPASSEYYLIVYNATSDNIYVSFYSENKKVESGKQFNSQIDKSQYDNLWLGEATEHLFIYKGINSTNISQSIYNTPTVSVDSVFGEFSSEMNINGKTIKRYCKTFRVTDKMFEKY
jgi:hypothetical protein